VFDLFHGAVPARIALTVDGSEPLVFTVADRATAERRLVGSDEAERPTASSLEAPLLDSWQRADEDWSVAPGKQHEHPLDFSKAGQFSGHLVYEADIDLPQAGDHTVVFPRLEDPARVYVNGKFAGRLAEIGADVIRLPLSAGSNKLSVLVQNMGRFNYSQAMGEPKGLSAAPAIDGEAIDMLDGWQVEDTGRVHSLKAIPPLEGRIGFTRRFDNTHGYDRAVLVGYGLSKMKINGLAVSPMMETVNAWNRHQATFGVADVSNLLVQGNNELEIDVSGINSISRMMLYVYRNERQIAPWTTRPAALPESPKNWRDMAVTDISRGAPGGATNGQPVWYKSEFTCDPQVMNDTGAKLKVYLGGLGKGACWVNGFCIGRFWQIGPQEFYKIPVSLLRERNELLICDEEGCEPDKVFLQFH
jgi:hypothetical protein